jgi:hypothetical protein
LLLTFAHPALAAPAACLVLSAADFRDLQGAQLTDAEGAPGGKAVLVHEVGGCAAARLTIGPAGALPVGLYRIAAQLGSRDGATHWAAVQTLPRWRWFVATAVGEATEAATWPTTEHLVTPPYRGQPASPQRRILFLKPSTGRADWVVYELVEPQGESGSHSLQLLFHATPTSLAQVADSGRAVRIAAAKAGLLILLRSDRPWTASVVRGDARPEELHWQVFVAGGYAKPLVPTDCAIFQHDGPLPAAAASVLFPHPNDGPAEMAAECRSGNLASVPLIDGGLLRVGREATIDLHGRRAHYVECAAALGAKPAGVTLGNDLAVSELHWERK